MRAVQALAGLVARSIENPANQLTESALSAALATPGALWGTAAQADPMRIGAVMRCVSILSSGVAGCPVRITDVETHEKQSVPVITAPTSGATAFERWETVVAHLALWGNAYIRKIRSRDGRLVALLPIHPARVHVDIDDDAARLVGLPFVKRFAVDGRVQLTEREVMHIPALSLDGVEGLSIIGNLRRTFDLLTDAELVAQRLYSQGFLGQGFITSDQKMDAERSQIVRDRWRAKTASLDNAFDVPILDNGAKFQQMSMNPIDAQFLESRRFQITEIARIFGVPSWIINDQEKSTSWGSGMEQQFIAFVVVTLKPYFHRIEQRITRELLDPTREKAEFKVEGLLRGDSKSRAAFYASGVQHGWLVPNDIRKLEDMAPVEWGDEPYRPYNEPANGTTTNAGDEDDDADADA